MAKQIVADGSKLNVTDDARIKAEINPRTAGDFADKIRGVESDRGLGAGEIEQLMGLFPKNEVIGLGESLRTEEDHSLRKLGLNLKLSVSDSKPIRERALASLAENHDAGGQIVTAEIIGIQPTQLGGFEPEAVSPSVAGRDTIVFNPAGRGTKYSPTLEAGGSVRDPLEEHLRDAGKRRSSEETPEVVAERDRLLDMTLMSIGIPPDELSSMDYQRMIKRSVEFINQNPGVRDWLVFHNTLNSIEPRPFRGELSMRDQSKVHWVQGDTNEAFDERARERKASDIALTARNHILDDIRRLRITEGQI